MFFRVVVELGPTINFRLRMDGTTCKDNVQPDSFSEFPAASVSFSNEKRGRYLQHERAYVSFYPFAAREYDFPSSSMFAWVQKLAQAQGILLERQSIAGILRWRYRFPDTIAKCVWLSLSLLQAINFSKLAIRSQLWAEIHTRRNIAAHFSYYSVHCDKALSKIIQLPTGASARLLWMIESMESHAIKTKHSYTRSHVPFTVKL